MVTYGINVFYRFSECFVLNRLRPRILRDVSEIDTITEVLGTKVMNVSDE